MWEDIKRDWYMMSGEGKGFVIFCLSLVALLLYMLAAPVGLRDVECKVYAHAVVVGPENHTPTVDIDYRMENTYVEYGKVVMLDNGRWQELDVPLKLGKRDCEADYWTVLRNAAYVLNGRPLEEGVALPTDLYDTLVGIRKMQGVE